MKSIFSLLSSLVLVVGLSVSAHADNLYRPGEHSNLISDNKASRIGDILTVIVYQNTEASNTASMRSSRQTDIDGGWRLTGVEEFGQARLATGYDGRGETRRRERFLTSFSVSVIDIVNDGTLLVGGTQVLYINGERSEVTLEGKVRVVDISSQNTVISTLLADAVISYDGEGFVTRGSNPGLVTWLLGVFGLVPV